MKRALLPLFVGLALGAVGCSGGTQNSPQATVTQLQQVATDAFLTTAVKAKLITIDVNSTTTLGVRVAGGVATLSGAVRSPAARERAVAAARSVKGIVAVRDRLRIDPQLPNISQDVSDAALAGRIAAAIFTETGAGVKVDVRNGVVTLRGHVVDPNVRDAAVEAARHTTGVHTVHDEMGS